MAEILDIREVLKDYATQIRFAYHLFPTCMTMGAFFLLAADPSWQTFFFIIGYLGTELISIISVYITGYRDVADGAEKLPFSNHKLPHTIQGFSYILGFFTVTFFQKKKYYSLFATVALTILIFMIDIISMDLENTNWQLEMPIKVFAYGIGLFVGLFMGSMVEKTDNEKEKSEPEKVCKAYQNGVMVATLNTP